MSAYQFDLGSYEDQPNFLMRSRRGFCWANIPPTLLTLVTIPNMFVACESFALGPDGHFYFKYRTADKSIKQVTSEGFWALFASPWAGSWIERIEFGELGVVWGIKTYTEPEPDASDPTNKKKMQEMFGPGVPSIMAAKIHELDTAGAMPSYSALRFVALGEGGSWVLAVKGAVYHHGLEQGLWEFIAAEERAVINIKLCPIRRDIFWVELSDGATYYVLPKAWLAPVAHFTGPQYHLTPPRIPVTASPKSSALISGSVITQAKE